MDDALSSFFRALPMPALRIGPDERVTHTNAGVEEMLGADRRGLHYITALRQPDLLDAIEQCLRDGKPRSSRFASGEGTRSESWQVALTRLDQPLAGLLLVFEDITAVESAGQQRRDFVANVSHELRTPLTALLGFIETLGGAARNDPEARDRFLAIMRHEAGRMAALVDDLLSLSRVEDEERHRPTAPVSLPEIIRQVIYAQSPAADDAEVEVVATIPDELPTVPGDMRQLEQVVSNLLANAIKYGGSGGRVNISVEGPVRLAALRSEGVRLTVQDHGEGVAPHHLARLTERFYRVDTHRSRQVGGTGLGLAIVKHIVNRHRGRMRVDSVQGKGMTITVDLPLS